MAFSERFLDELAARNDIVDVVSGYVQLTKRSGSNMFGLCPFHSEKTPSFSVSADKQIYHCFGCGKGGGVINFIMEIEGLGFRESVEFLAKRAGLEVPDDDTPDETKNRRARMLELNRDAARFFYGQLSSEAGKTAIEYINRRGISPEMVKKFGLGAAIDSWSALVDAMTKKGYTQRELLDAGLAKQSSKGGGIYDAFRNRLMFPVIDIRGSVIGFSGRILDDGEPKYLNSPDTLVFNKSRNLFAMNLAKKSKQGMIILAEGNVDVVSLHQAGFDCAVASLGTSLTPDQVRLIDRYTDSVVIAYDSDAAGVKAAQRAIKLFENTGISVKILKMSGAKDPDEFIKKRGADAFKLLLEQSENHIEYRLMLVKEKYDLDTDDGRIAFLSEATELLSGISSAVEREVYGARAAEYAGVSPEAVRNEVKNAFRRRIRADKKRAEREELRPAAKAQPRDREIRYENVSSAVAEEGVVRLMLLDPSVIGLASSLSPEDFTSPFLAKVFTLITERAGDGKQMAVTSFSEALSGAEMSRLTAILQKPEQLSSSEKTMADYIEKIKTEKLIRSDGADLLAVSQKYREKKGYGG